MSIQDELIAEVRGFKQLCEAKDAKRRSEPDPYGEIRRASVQLDNKGSMDFPAVQIRPSDSPPKKAPDPFLCGGVGLCGAALKLTISNNTSEPGVNGTWMLPFTQRLVGVDGNEVCVWKYTTPGGYVFFIGYLQSFAPHGYYVQLQTPGLIDFFEGGAIASVPGDIGQTLTNQIVQTPPDPTLATINRF